jgi:hypothetical protein
MPGDYLNPSHLQQEAMRVGPQMRDSAVKLIGDPRVGNFTAPDQIEVLFSLIDPTKHEVARDPGQTYVRGISTTARAANYAVYRSIGPEITGRTVKEILDQTTAELDGLQQGLITAVNEHRPGFDAYLDHLAHFAAVYFALEGPPLSTLTYLKPFGENISVLGLTKPLSLGRVKNGMIELASGIRGVAAIKELSGTGLPLTLMDINPHITRVLTHYAQVTGARHVDVRQDDVRTTNAIREKGTAIASGLHHLNDGDIEAFVSNVATSLPADGVFYYRDSEAENPGLATVVRSALQKQNLHIIHQDTLPQTKGFEFIARK